jgi:hypothetical protein
MKNRLYLTYRTKICNKATLQYSNFATFAKERRKSLVKAETDKEMTNSDKSRKKDSKVDVGVEMMTGAAAAMLYSDEEIRDIFSKEDADEFIELRRQARENFAPKGYDVEEDETQLPLAAEDDSDY